MGMIFIPNAFGVQYPVLIHGGVADNREMNFSPSERPIEKGDTVRWKVLELNTVHTVTFASLDIDRELVQWRCTEIGECSSQQVSAFSYTFEERGTYNYNCKMHSWMNGVVKVIEFGSDAEVRSELQQRYQYVLIDEYQDTNRTQFVIADHIASKHKNICVVGDPDQTIYEYAGSDAKWFHEEAAKPFHELKQGLRCGKAINEYCKEIIDPSSGMGVWAMHLIAEKDWKDIDV
jgi:superfamily I DNA/RNA helicase